MPLPDKSKPEFFYRKANRYGWNVNNFSNLLDPKSPPTDGNEGLRGLRVLNAGQGPLNQFSQKILMAEEKGPSCKIGATSTGNQDCFIHDAAVIDSGCRIGQETKNWHFSHVLKNSKIGKYAFVGAGTVVLKDVPDYAMIVGNPGVIIKG